jgi:hypothetical protein
VSTNPEPTAEISPDQAWGLIWNELKRVGIAPGHRGPFEGGVLWGENTNQAIEGLREMNLPIPAICHLGLIVQAAIRAAEVRFRKPTPNRVELGHRPQLAQRAR